VEQISFVDLGDTMEHVYTEPILDALLGRQIIRREWDTRDDLAAVAQIVGVFD
jgi:hypothetical protein